MTNQQIKGQFSLMGCFTSSLKLYADNFWALLSVSLAAIIPSLLRILLLPQGVQESVTADAGLLFGPVIFCVYTFFLMCLISMIKSFSEEEAVSFYDVMVKVLPKTCIGIAGYILYMLAVMVGLILLIVPGVYCFTVFAFFIFFILSEDKGLIESFKRSKEIVQSVFAKVFFAHFMLLFVSALIFLPVILGMGMFGVNERLTAFVTTLMGGVTAPVSAGFYYFLYLALKKDNDGVLNISVTSA